MAAAPYSECDIKSMCNANVFMFTFYVLPFNTNYVQSPRYSSYTLVVRLCVGIIVNIIVELCLLFSFFIRLRSLG